MYETFHNREEYHSFSVKRRREKSVCGTIKMKEMVTEIEREANNLQSIPPFLVKYKLTKTL